MRKYRRWQWWSDVVLVCNFLVLLVTPSLWLGVDLTLLASWYEPAFAYFLPVCGVVVAALVPLAIATDFGRGSRRFEDKTKQALLASVVLGVLIVAVLAAALIFVAAVHPSRWVDVAMLLPVAWMLFLVSRVVFGAASVRERAVDAAQ